MEKDFFLFTYGTSSWSYLVLKTIGKLETSLSDFVMTFLSQHIIFRYCNMKKTKTSSHKKCMHNEKYLISM